LAAVTRRLSAVLAILALLVAAPAAYAIYQKPAGGKWTIQDAFERTDGGAMTISKDRTKLTKLVLNVGEDWVATCETERIRLASKPKIKKFASAGGRYAIGAQRRGSSLIVPVRATFKVGGKRVNGKIIMLWDEAGRLATSASVETPNCGLSFNARKGR
jgi:hypothetical protein